MIASGTEQKFDTIISIATLIGALIFILFGIAIESYLAIAISILLIKSGIEMLKQTISEILGQRIDGNISKKIKQAICSLDGVEGVYDLLFADYGPDRIFASAHIEVSDKMTIPALDLLIRQITEKIYNEYGIVMLAIGIYSNNGNNSEALKIKDQIIGIIKQYKYITQMHGFYADFDRKILIFDLVVDFAVHNRKGYFDNVIIKTQENYPDFKLIAILDSDFSN